jgi:thioredoxin reductase
MEQYIPFILFAGIFLAFVFFLFMKKNKKKITNVTQAPEYLAVVETVDAVLKNEKVAEKEQSKVVDIVLDENGKVNVVVKDEKLTGPMRDGIEKALPNGKVVVIYKKM